MYFAKTLPRSVISDGLVVKANDNTKIVANTLKVSMTAIRYDSAVAQHQMRDLDQTTKQLCNLVRKYPGKSILPAGQGLPQSRSGTIATESIKRLKHTTDRLPGEGVVVTPMRQMIDKLLEEGVQMLPLGNDGCFLEAARRNGTEFYLIVSQTKSPSQTYF